MLKLIKEILLKYYVEPVIATIKWIYANQELSVVLFLVLGVIGGFVIWEAFVDPGTIKDMFLK